MRAEMESIPEILMLLNPTEANIRLPLYLQMHVEKWRRHFAAAAVSLFSTLQRHIRMVH